VGIERFDRVPLLFGPSPVHRLERLSEHLGGAVDIWAKREDCNSGLAYGGNKVRKLEYLAADALAQGCNKLVSIGGVQSNLTRQVAAVAARLGLRCVLVQERWVEWPDVVYDKVGNVLLSRIMGADVRLDPSGFDIGIRRSWEDALASVEESGGKPYAIPAGASDHPLGGLGFARWADEVAAQERELSVFFDTVVVCSVTGSTQAGMVAGFAVQETDRAVLGIDGSATVAQTWAQIARIARPRPRPSSRDASSTTRRSSSSMSGTQARTASRTRRRSTPFVCALAWKGCSPIPCTRASRWLR
jgi:1-aminocyclopropane-1-carboxylate deaminase